MISRQEMETVLQANGLGPGSSESRIRAALISAKFDQSDIDTAITVLRHEDHATHPELHSLHKVFHTNHTLAPNEISQLLGIEVDVTDEVPLQERGHKLSRFQHAFVWVTSLALAVGGLLLYMYAEGVGVFHPSMTL